MMSTSLCFVCNIDQDSYATYPTLLPQIAKAKRVKLPFHIPHTPFGPYTAHLWLAVLFWGVPWDVPWDQILRQEDRQQGGENMVWFASLHCPLEKALLRTIHTNNWRITIFQESRCLCFQLLCLPVTLGSLWQGHRQAEMAPGPAWVELFIVRFSRLFWGSSSHIWNKPSGSH